MLISLKCIKTAKECWNCSESMIYSPTVPIFITLGQDVHENRQMQHKYVDGFPLPDDIFPINYNLIFGASTDEMKAKPDNFF